MHDHTRSVPECAWFKSSYSGGNATECVEVAITRDAVRIRDSKRRGEGHLAVRSDTWSRFVASV
ncbi:DUF397 domain-containing protein [Streptomyces sp. NPDC059063]|uniref:DUF397 domain-containing protein n=1 Tax=unclassified Streptomyces TaxID=2593676 RepID=UPI0036C146EA